MSERAVVGRSLSDRRVEPQVQKEEESRRQDGDRTERAYMQEVSSVVSAAVADDPINSLTQTQDGENEGGSQYQRLKQRIKEVA